jgi:hypothetical protein
LGYPGDGVKTKVLFTDGRIKKIIDQQDGSFDVLIYAEHRWQFHDNVGSETVTRMLMEASEIYEAVMP